MSSISELYVVLLFDLRGRLLCLIGCLAASSFSSSKVSLLEGIQASLLSFIQKLSGTNCGEIESELLLSLSPPLSPGICAPESGAPARSSADPLSAPGSVPGSVGGLAPSSAGPCPLSAASRGATPCSLAACKSRQKGRVGGFHWKDPATSTHSP